MAHEALRLWAGALAAAAAEAAALRATASKARSDMLPLPELEAALAASSARHAAVLPEAAEARAALEARIALRRRAVGDWRWGSIALSRCTTARRIRFIPDSLR